MYYNIILSLDHSEIIYWYCLLLEIIRAAKWTVCPIKRTRFVGNTNRYHWTPSSLLFCGRNWLKITLYTRKLFEAPRKVIWYGMDSNGLGWHKSFAHIKHHASAVVGQDGLLYTVLTPEYLLSS